MKDWFSRNPWDKEICSKCNFASLLIVLFLQCSHSFVLSHVPNCKNSINGIYQNASGLWLSMTTWVSLEVFIPFFFYFQRHCLFLFSKRNWSVIPLIAEIITVSSILLFPTYAELPGKYFFFVKGGFNWPVNLNRSHLIFQDFQQHKLVLETLNGIGLRQILYSTHFISMIY